MNTSSTSLPAHRHPTGLNVLFFTELWERFSYYGMRALLVLFMVSQVENGGMGLDDTTATAIYGLYTAAIYLAALPGGWIGDVWLGAKRTVWYGGLVIMLGHFTLAIPADWSFYPGLVLVVLGTGLLKPNVSAMVGHLYAPSHHAQRDSGFVLFYMGINIGAALGPLVCSALGESDYGWHAGFAAAGIGMMMGLLWYRFGITRLDAVPMPSVRPSRQSYVALGVGVLLVLSVLWWLGNVAPPATLLVRHAGWVLLAIFVIYLLRLLLLSGLDSDGRKRVLAIAVLCLAGAVFWSGFEQAGSSFSLFAERYTQRVVFDWEIPTGWFQSLNPVFIIILAPLYSAMWPLLARRHMNPATPVKFALALLILSAGFALMVFAATLVVSGATSVAATWLVSTYFVHTVAELLLSPVGLSAISRYAPAKLIGQMMGLWFMTAALGNLLAGVFASAAAQDQLLDMPALYTRIAIISAAGGVVMLLLSPLLKRLLRER